MKQLDLVLFLCLISATTANAYTVIVISTTTTENTEKILLNQIATEFDASIYVNPFAAGTYQVKLFGLNPNYEPSDVIIDTTTWFSNIQAMQALEAFISTDSYTNGWANGMQYERSSNISFLRQTRLLCSSNSTFWVAGTTDYITPDPITCGSVLDYSENSLYQLNFATPTIISGNYNASVSTWTIPSCPSVSISSCTTVKADALDCYYVCINPNGTENSLQWVQCLN